MAEEEAGSGEPAGEEERLRKRAEEAVSARIKLLSMIGVFIFVNALCIAVYYLTDGSGLWFLWVVLGTGVALFFSLWNYFTGKSSGAKKEEMVEREMEKMKSKKE